MRLELELEIDHLVLEVIVASRSLELIPLGLRRWHLWLISVVEHRRRWWRWRVHQQHAQIVVARLLLLLLLLLLKTLHLKLLLVAVIVHRICFCLYHELRRRRQKEEENKKEKNGKLNTTLSVEQVAVIVKIEHGLSILAVATVAVAAAAGHAVVVEVHGV